MTDFAGMLAAIVVGQSVTATAGHTAADCAGVPAAIAGAANALSPATSAAVGAHSVSVGIAAAVGAGCLGMANLRLQRGDVQGAVLWSDLASDGTTGNEGFSGCAGADRAGW